MAQIDVTQIEGYDDMSTEEKLQALEAFEIPEPDYKGYIKKAVFDKTASELAELKRKNKEKLSEEEALREKEKEEREALVEKYNTLLRETEISKHTAKLVSLGYDSKLAEDTAIAMVDGDTDKVFSNQKKHLESVEKKIKADVLKDTPKPVDDGKPDVMSLEKLRGMSLEERIKFSEEHPEEYKLLYGGN